MALATVMGRRAGGKLDTSCLPIGPRVCPDRAAENRTDAPVGSRNTESTTLAFGRINGRKTLDGPLRACLQAKVGPTESQRLESRDCRAHAPGPLHRPVASESCGRQVRAR
jgi:hypothetical protein